MKYFGSILLILSLMFLIQIADAHKHKHKHHHHSNSTTLTLKSCASKLDFLCLGRLYNQLENYKSNVSSIISDLEDRVEDRIDAFEVGRHKAENDERILIFENALFLQQRITQISIFNVTGNVSCARGYESEVITYRNDLLKLVDDCIANNSFNRTAVQNDVNNLNNTALAAEDKLCDCVERITTCSTKSDIQAAKGCALAAASSINYDSIQQQADTIYNSVDAKASAALTAVNSCLNAIPVVSNRVTLLAKINKCVE